MYRKIFSGGAAVLLLAACGGADQQGGGAVMAEAPFPEESQSAATTEAAQPARAVFINEQGTEIGTATLTQEGDAVRIVVDLAFLQAGQRGFHIHEVGSCEAPDFSSAGAHFNPTNAAHGFDNPDGPHAGDLRNLEVETDDGTARATLTNNMVTLVPGQPNSLLDADGSALVVHAEADDYTSQPAGNSGPRIACGVIVPA